MDGKIINILFFFQRIERGWSISSWTGNYVITEHGWMLNQELKWRKRKRQMSSFSLALCVRPRNTFVNFFFISQKYEYGRGLQGPNVKVWSTFITSPHKEVPVTLQPSICHCQCRNTTRSGAASLLDGHSMKHKKIYVSVARTMKMRTFACSTFSKITV